MAGRGTYLWRSVQQHRRRFMLVVAFVAAGVALIVLSTAAGNALSMNIERGQDDRLLVLNGLSAQYPLPQFYQARIAALDGVAQVSHAAWVGAYFREPGWHVPAIAVDSASFFSANPTLRVSPEVHAAWQADRRGVLLDQRFAQRYELAVGDRLPLQSSIWSLPGQGLDLQIRGIVIDSEPSNPAAVYLHYDYLESSRANGRGLTSYFIVRPVPGRDLAVLAREIDRQFEGERQRGTTQSAPARVHMKLFASKLFDFGRAIQIANLGTCALLLLLLAANLHVVAQKSLADHAVFRRLGFSQGWTATTLAMHLGLYVACGVALGTLAGWLLLQLLPQVSPVPLSGLVLVAADWQALAALTLLMLAVAVLPAALHSRVVRPGVAA